MTVPVSEPATMHALTIDGQTRLMGVMGWPVEHSLSPTMHNAALTELGLNACYVPLPVQPGQVAAAVNGMVALGFQGFNITVPHKQAVLPLLHDIAPEAQALGAVNTVVIRLYAGELPRLHGYNTDVAGFLGALREGGFEAGPGQRVLVIGAGGAARAIVYALGRAGVDAVTVLNRTMARAVAMVDAISQVLPPTTEARAGALSAEALLEAARSSDLLVNTTTVGMWPATESSIWPANLPFPAHLTVYDLVYNPLETQLLAQARRAGARAIDGLGMLALQGALALDLWLEQPLDVPAVARLMRRAAASHLGVS